MKSYYRTLILKVFISALIYTWLIVLFAWFTAPWVYACFLLIILDGIRDTNKIAANLKEITQRLAHINTLQAEACLSTHFDEFQNCQEQLKRISSNSNILLYETLKLLKQVESLEQKATSYVSHVRETLHLRRSKQFLHPEILPAPQALQNAVKEILNLRALQSPKFRQAPPHKRKEVVKAFSAAYAVKLGVASETVYNIVMGRLCSHLKQAA